MTKTPNPVHSVPKASWRTEENYFGQKVTTGECSVCGTVKLNSQGVNKGFACSVRKAANDALRRSYNGFNKGTFCYRCNKTHRAPDAMTVHHKNGDNDDNAHTNLVPVCKSCHADLEWLVNQIKVLKNEYIAEFEKLQAEGFFSQDYKDKAGRLGN